MTHNEIKQRIMEGSKLAVKRLIARKKKENAYLVISEKGKVVKILAADIK
jgi:primosomal replication protein N